MRRTAKPPSAAPVPEAPDPTGSPSADESTLHGSTEPGPSAAIDLSGLPVAGLSRRRLGFLVGAFVSAWIVIVFARQAGEAAAATARVDQMRTANAELSAQVDALERELQLIQRQEYIVQQARAYRLGQSAEQPFALGADAPPLAPDAPGSAALRLGAAPPPVTPLESWLSTLFGPVR